jgi:hypothetical protein
VLLCASPFAQKGRHAQITVHLLLFIQVTLVSNLIKNETCASKAHIRLSSHVQGAHLLHAGMSSLPNKRVANTGSSLIYVSDVLFLCSVGR